MGEQRSGLGRQRRFFGEGYLSGDYVSQATSWERTVLVVGTSQAQGAVTAQRKMARLRDSERDFQTGSSRSGYEHSKLQTTENGILESSDIADVLFKDDLVLPSEEVRLHGELSTWGAGDLDIRG